MTRRWIYPRTLSIAASLVVGVALLLAMHAQIEPPPPVLPAPISVYDNWSAYVELSDNVPLTEARSLCASWTKCCV
jgi:hypothetical protein